MERYEKYYNIRFKEFFNILRYEPEIFLLRKDLVLMHEFMQAGYPWNRNIEDKELYYMFAYENFENYTLAFFKERNLLKK